MTDPEESLAAERVIESLGRPPKSQAEMFRECEVGQVIPLESFLQTELAIGRRMKIPLMESTTHWFAETQNIKPATFSYRVFERVAAGWERIE